MNHASPPLVLHVIHHLVIGGMENGLVNLINEMPASSFRHAVVCVEDFSGFRERISRPEVEVMALFRSVNGVAHVRREIFRHCRRLRPAIVHTRGLSGLDALLPARLAGVPRCVHGEHGWDLHDLHGSRLRPALLRRLHAPLVSRYVTVSRDLQSYLRERVGIAASRITQIYNGVDTQRFSPRGVDADDLLPPGLQGSDVVLIGSVGRIQPVKAQATLVRAFAVLGERRPDLRERLRLAIVGDGPLLGELKALAESLGVASRAWFPGARADIPQLLRSLDVFVLPSLNEGISNTLLEAMASGVPVVATAVGGNVEIVQDGVQGRLFEPLDVEGLADLLERYAADASLREAHGAAGRSSSVARFSLDGMVRAYEAVYEELTGHAARAARAPA